MIKAKKILAMITMAAAILLSGCQETLYEGISEADANEMLSTLLKRNIDAKKISSGKGLFAISVDESDMVRALDIIRENSLPRASYQSLGSIFSGQSMISSQLEEQARFAFGLSQELSATFSKIDGVLDARVHVTLVQHEQSSGLTTPPSAAVFLRHTPSSPVINMTGDIKETAARAVPGLTSDRVSVMLESFSEKIIPPAKKTIPWYLSNSAYIAYGIIGTLLAVALSFLFLYKRRIVYIASHKSNEDKS